MNRRYRWTFVLTWFGLIAGCVAFWAAVALGVISVTR